MNKRVITVLLTILFANLAVVLIKVFIGIFYNSNSVLADGLHAISDSSSNIIAIIGIKLSMKKPDKNYRYGYYKFETIASMLIGILLCFITFVIFSNAVKFFISPKEIKTSFTSLLLLVVGLIINFFVYIIEMKKGKKYNSKILQVDALHTGSDCLLSLGVLISSVLITFGVNPIIDPIVSIIIGFVILKSAISILKETLQILIDINVIDEDELKTYVYKLSDNIIDIHKIRSRGNERYKYIDMHIIVPPYMTVKEAHDLNHLIERALIEYYGCYTDTICHIEPDERNVYT